MTGINDFRHFGRLVYLSNHNSPEIPTVASPHPKGGFRACVGLFCERARNICVKRQVTLTPNSCPTFLSGLFHLRAQTSMPKRILSHRILQLPKRDSGIFL